MIEIESRTLGDHEELKYFFQKCLIFLRFIEKFSLKREEHRFIEILTGKICIVQFAKGALDG